VVLTAIQRSGKSKIIFYKSRDTYDAFDVITFMVTCRGADKSLARPGRKHATATEDFDFHISYL